jgi:hypothetical protein
VAEGADIGKAIDDAMKAISCVQSKGDATEPES